MEIVEERRTIICLTDREKETLLNAQRIMDELNIIMEENNYLNIECNCANYQEEDLIRCSEILEEIANVHYLVE